MKNKRNSSAGKGTINFSVRMPPEWQEAIRGAAALAGVSSNVWISQCAYECTKMIDTPEGKEVPIPRPVATARYLKHSGAKVIPLD